MPGKDKLLTFRRVWSDDESRRPTGHRYSHGEQSGLDTVKAFVAPRTCRHLYQSNSWSHWYVYFPNLAGACVLTLISAARKYVLCQYNIHRDHIAAATQITPGKRAPSISRLDTDDSWVAVSSMVEKKTIATVMDDLAKCGATDILILPIMNSR